MVGEVAREVVRSALVSTLRVVPIYEYVCMKCEEQFEELVHGDSKPVCPACSGSNVIRKFSTFATKGGAKSCGSCAGGSCGGCGSR